MSRQCATFRSKVGFSLSLSAFLCLAQRTHVLRARDCHTQRAHARRRAFYRGICDGEGPPRNLVIVTASQSPIREESHHGGVARARNCTQPPNRSARSRRKRKFDRQLVGDAYRRSGRGRHLQCHRRCKTGERWKTSSESKLLRPDTTSRRE